MHDVVKRPGARSTAFDAAFDLWRLCSGEGDAELIESAAEQCGLAATGELFVERPAIIVANEDAAAIAIDTEAAQQALETQRQKQKQKLGVGGRMRIHLVVQIHP